MIVRGAVRAIAGLALVAAVSACDDNPLAENREDAEYFRLSTSDAVVEVGGNIGLRANVLNKYGAALVVNITASECDAKVSVAKDTIRSEYEYPELFRITGNSAGVSCVVVNGGGVTDTVRVRVVPASIDLSAARDTVDSGATVPLNVAYLGATGAAAPGATFSPTTTKFTVRTSSVGVVDSMGNFTARAPGNTWVVATNTSLGVTRTDSLRLTVVAGLFTGTLSTSSAPAGSIITLTAGAIPFDNDTQVTFDGQPSFVHSRSATTMRVVVGPTETGTSTTMVLTNMGPDQIAAIAPFTVTSNVDPTEPNNGLASAISAAPGDTVYVVMDATDFSDLVRVDLAAARSLDLTLHWYPTGTDLDIYFYTAAGSQDTSKGGCASASVPEHCANTFAAGTWYLRLYNWEQDPNRTYTLARLIIAP